LAEKNFKKLIAEIITKQVKVSSPVLAWAKNIKQSRFEVCTFEDKHYDYIY
jgi:hypothetical protein